MLIVDMKCLFSFATLYLSSLLRSLVLYRVKIR